MNRFTPELDQSFWEELRRKILDSLGGQPRLSSLSNALNEDLDAMQTLVHPRMIYTEEKIVSLDEYIHTRAGLIQSRMFARLARRCSPDCSVIFMIATLGNEFDKFCRLQKGLSRQFMVDIAGSACVEMVADLLSGHVLKRAGHEGKCLSMRFSPGYCDWHLTGQRLIFNALDGTTVGVSLNGYDVMVPTKTISAAVLIADNVPVKAPCCFCESDGCPWRRLPYKEEGSADQDNNM